MAKKLLLVQNQENLRRLMGAFFSQHFEIAVAKTGLEAMGWLSRGFIPDAIIADVSSPELNGTQLVINLRYSGMFSHIPVILTGSSMTESEEKGLQHKLGISKFFGTPFCLLQLREHISQLALPVREFQWAGANAA